MSVNHESDLLLLTCASGKQCSYILPHIYPKWRRLRLVVNSTASLNRLKSSYPNADVVQADLTDVNDVRRVMCDVTVVYHVGPTYHPHEIQIGYFMIDAAIRESKRIDVRERTSRTSGVSGGDREGGSFKHFFLSSVLNTQFRKMMNHDCKRYIEEYLMESGLNYTIIQPSHFMDNIPIKLLAEQEHPVYNANWDPKIPFSFVVLKDLGEVCAKILDEREKHYMATYPLCSTGPITYVDLMKDVGEVLAKEIKIEQRSFEDAVGAFMNLLYGKNVDEVHPTSRDVAQRMLLFYNFRGLIGNPNVLEWLLERKPTTVREWVSEKISIPQK